MDSAGGLMRRQESTLSYHRTKILVPRRKGILSEAWKTLLSRPSLMAIF
jgi:hypothetical protein